MDVSSIENRFRASLRAAREPDAQPPVDEAERAPAAAETACRGEGEGESKGGSTDGVTGRVARVVFQSVRFGVVHVVGDDGGCVTACGPTLHDAHVGERLALEGVWEVDQRFGRQLRVTGVRREAPATVDGLVACLAALVDGVGPGLARRLVDALGGVPETLRWLDASDRESEIVGVRPSLVLPLRAEWQRRRGEQAIELGLASLGLTPGLRTKLRVRYGVEALSVCQRRPFDLAFEVEGIGFVLADSIALKVGVPRDSIERKTAALLYALEDDASSRGHTFMPKDDAARAVAKLCDVTVSGADVDAACEELARRRLVFVGPSGGIGVFRLIEAEARIAEQVHALTQRSVSALACGPSPALARLVDEQRAAVERMASAALLVMTGGPGVGKTTTTQAVCELWKSAGLRMALCAPTGRAARRLSEATGMEATTIHRLLAWRPGVGFSYCASNPLDVDALLVDETSMVDVELLRALLEALPPHGRLVLVGDADQLPPVGPGAPFRDLCARQDVPIARLTQVHRQAQGSRIVGASREVLAGVRPTPSAKGDRTDGTLFVIEESSPVDLCALIVDAVEVHVPATFGVPSSAVQVIAPMRKGAVGVTALNRALQVRLNPRPTAQIFVVGGDAPVSEYRMGDRVMQTKNDYDRGVVNGELGTVATVNNESVTVQFADALVSYQRGELRNLDLAYCSTVHKVQGAEFPVCLIVCHDSHSIMLERALLYTAMTRAKRACVLMGSTKALARAVKTARSDARRTTLPGRLAALGVA